MVVNLFKKNNRFLNTDVPLMFLKDINNKSLSFKELYKLFVTNIRFLNFAFISELMDKKISYNEIIDILSSDYSMKKDESVLNIHSFIVQNFPSSIFNDIEQRKKYYTLYSRTMIYVKSVFLTMNENNLVIIKNDFLKSFELYFSFLFKVLKINIIYGRKDGKLLENYLPLVNKNHVFLYSGSTGYFIDVFPFAVYNDDKIHFWVANQMSFFEYEDEDGKLANLKDNNIKQKFIEYCENYLLTEQFNDLLYNNYDKSKVELLNNLIKIKKDILNDDYKALITDITNYKYSGDKLYEDTNYLFEYYYAYSHQKLGSISKAKTLFENLIENSPDFYYPYFNLFDIYNNMGEIPKLGTIAKKLKKIVFSQEIINRLDKMMNSLIKKKKLQYKNIENDLVDLKEKVENISPTIIGRTSETEEVLYILNCMHRNSVLIIGDSGVGKTTVVYNVVNKILKNDVPDKLKDIPVYELNVGSTLSGTKYRGQLEEKFQQILSKIKDEEAILFIDDLNFLVTSDVSKSSSVDFPSMIKPFLENSKIKIIATTDYDSYIGTISKYPVFNRLFQSIRLKELGDNENSIILKLKAFEFEKHHNIKIDIESLSKYFSLIKQFFRDRMLPDKAIELLDKTCARVNYDYEKGDRDDNIVSEVDFLKTIANSRGVELSTVSVHLKDKLKFLSDNLKKRIKGQDDVVDSLVQTIVPSKMGLKINPSKPDGIFLFIGPTGVGKTELAKALAKELYGDENKLLRFDMSEYMEEFTFSRLIGAAPGYVGYYDQNQLTDAMKKDPYRVVLLDEIEKAHPQLINIFLQVFDSGVLTDARGKKAYFDKSIIIMTSNIGTSLFSKINVGFSENESEHNVTKTELESEMKRFFKPEFLNRIDSILFFNSLNINIMKEIVKQKIEELNNTLSSEDIKITLDDDAIEYIAKEGFSEEYGARELLRIIQSKVLLKIADYKLHNDESITEVLFTCKDNSLILNSRISKKEEPIIYPDNTGSENFKENLTDKN